MTNKIYSRKGGSNIKINQYTMLIKWRKKHNLLNRSKKGIWQNPTRSHDKNTQQETRKRVDFPQPDEKLIYKKLTGITILNGEKRKSFSLKSGIRQRCCSQHCYSTLYWKFKPGQLDKKKKSHPDWKGRSKIISLHRWHNLIHRKP